MKNLFVLKSPLQIINALEAVAHFKLSNNIFVLIYTDSLVNENQMRELADSNSMPDIEFIHVKKEFKSKFLKYVQLIKEFKKDSYNHIFLGEIGKFHKVLLANIKKEKVFLLDDGTATIKFYNEVIKTNKYNRYKFKEMRFLLFGLRVKIKDKINLFTYFDFEPIHGVEIVKNRLENLRKNNQGQECKHNEEIIYFIGEPLDQINVIDTDTYKDMIENLINMFKKKVIYIPHRYESKQLKKTVSSVDNKLFEIKNINKPIETYFIEQKIYPKHIISCSSTALTTLGMMYEEAIVNIIKIPENDNNRAYFDSFLREFYENSDKNRVITFRELGIIK
ncbi:MAG: hypothetical protein PHW89_03755 [Sulfurimonas denitrificans]|jgi:hypothetical protein|nr:hypothetical protein [Sulfurimonas denitrificans]